MSQPGDKRVLEFPTGQDEDTLIPPREFLLERRSPLRGALAVEEAPVLDPETVRERAQTLEELLDTVLRQSEEWLATLRWKSAWSQHLQFAGQLVPLLGGAAFLTQLSEHSNVVRNLLGVLTLLGSFVGLFAQHMEKTLLQGHKASELLPRLVEARTLAERLRRELHAWRRTAHDVEFGLELLHHGNRVSHNLHTLGPLIGGIPLRGLGRWLKAFFARPPARPVHA